MNFFIDVYLPLPLTKAFTYSVSIDEFGHISIGSRVTVPFGKSKIYTAIVIKKHQIAPQNYEAKKINSILDDTPLLFDYQIEFWKWIADYYHCSFGSVMKASIPSTLLLESETRIQINHEITIDKTKLTDEQFLIYEALEKSVLKIDEMTKITGNKNPINLIQPLINAGAVLSYQKIQERYKPKTERLLRLKNPKKIVFTLESLSRSHKQKDLILSILSIDKSGSKWISEKKINSKSNTNSQIVSKLIEKKIIEYKKVQIDRLSTNNEATLALQDLSKEQKRAFNEIKEELLTKNVILFQGITSSGKTAIYMKLIKELVEKGGQVLFLLPEISITSQMVNRFRNFFPNSVQVYHSKFNLNERTEIWKNIYKGDKNAQVIIGARSSLFLPFKKLDLIVVDEEHEKSYKQFDPAPRYHARDAAIYLSKILNSNIILGSATPSLESIVNVNKKKYGIVYLKERYGGVKPPEISIIDLKDSYKRKLTRGDFSNDLINGITDTLEKGKQIILFQNRRGYAPVLECFTCGNIPNCVQCDVTLTYHINSRKLQCHYCGYNIPIPKFCPSCSSSKISTKGSGTQQIEKQLEGFFPNVTVGRMDWDTTRGKNDFDRIIDLFSKQKIKILVGTQMIIKGLDFKNVHLVGVLNADHLINFPDFRSYERSFQMLTQVAGRSGRSSDQGKVIIQTYQPNHGVLKSVLNNDIDSFFKSELYDRKRNLYPPYVKLIRITFKNRSMFNLNSASDWFLNVLKQSFDGKILGPVSPVISRVRNNYIKEILVKLESDNSRIFFKKLLNKTIKSFDSISSFRSTRVIVDVDPY
ncbi:MAG: primosomal protein N' [Flavobacteriaceae bacterium]|nr:primosomal protein N' [Flavobacteriaceae bacterium]|tara:strand:+ start:10531 stop:12969 length:2439 start_codon:yes stop_codon:yes gene_type:complete